MSKQEEAGLILKLYELRREETMRKARDWYAMEFHPESMDDYTKALFSEHSAHLRMVTSYWEMAAALVNHGAIGMELFNDTNGEHMLVFSKLEPLLPQLRTLFSPEAFKNLEKLIDDTPGGRQKVAAFRERMKAVRAQMQGQQAAAAKSA
jgi:hypothetical protein